MSDKVEELTLDDEEQAKATTSAENDGSPPADEGDAPRQLPENPLEYLLEQGKTQGAVTYDEILEVMPELESNMDVLEDVFATLFDHGIDVVALKEQDSDDDEDEEGEDGGEEDEATAEKESLKKATSGNFY